MWICLLITFEWLQSRPRRKIQNNSGSIYALFGFIQVKNKYLQVLIQYHELLYNPIQCSYSCEASIVEIGQRDVTIWEVSRL